MKNILLLLFTSIILSSFAQEEHKVDLTELLKDIQQFESNDGNMEMTFWIPRCYWRIALEGRDEIAPETLGLIEDAFKDYELVCVLYVESNLDGTFDFTSEPKMRKDLIIKDSDGKKYKPLDTDELSEQVIYFDAMIKPMFSQMFGQMGEGMHFYYFEIKNKNDDNLINEFEASEFFVYHSNKEFKFSLPLPSLLPPKNCPIDNEEMKGNWKYCPIHGEALTD